MDKQLILQYKVLCGKFNNSYCLDILSDVDSQAIISETIAICGENDTVSCSPKCASLLESDTTDFRTSVTVNGAN